MAKLTIRRRQLSAEDQPWKMLVFLALLTAILHAGILYWLWRPAPLMKHMMPRPFKLEISMLSAPGTQIGAGQPTTAQSKPQITENQSPKASSVSNPKKQSTNKSTEATASAKPASGRQLKRNLQTEPVEQPLQIVASAGGSRTRHAYTKDNFQDSEIRNPSPEYPEMAAFLGYQGRVLIRVSVSAKGKSEKVEIVSSSGHKLLDDSATKAIRQWRFATDTLGGKTQGGRVMISVVFILHD